MQGECGMWGARIQAKYYPNVLIVLLNIVRGMLKEKGGCDEPPYATNRGRLTPMVEKVQIKDATLYLGDCEKILVSLYQSVDFILCDLPYGTTQNRWDTVLCLDTLWRQYRRLLKPKGAVALTGQGVFTARLILSNETWFKYKLVWEKSKATNFLNAKKQPLRKHEDVCIFYPCTPTYNPQMKAGDPYDKGIRKDQLTGSYGEFSPHHIQSDGARYPTDVLYFKTAESEAEQTVWHPTQKPVALMEYLIKTYTNPGDTVLDNTMGSGTTGVACAKLGRKFVGIEIEERYFDLACKRIEAAYDQPDMFSEPSPKPEQIALFPAA